MKSKKSCKDHGISHHPECECYGCLTQTEPEKVELRGNYYSHNGPFAWSSDVLISIGKFNGQWLVHIDHTWIWVSERKLKTRRLARSPVDIWNRLVETEWVDLKDKIAWLRQHIEGYK